MTSLAASQRVEFDQEPTVAQLFSLIALPLAAVGLYGVIPAQRAAAVDPVQAMRTE